jgi:acyl-CoA thioester hydrolase
MYQQTIRVIFRDVDALGHVNNAVYFTYMETARARFFMETLNWTEPALLPIIVAEASCAYLAPAHFNEELTLTVGVSRIGRKSFDLEYDITGEGGKAVARGKTVMVTYDYGERRTIPIPEALLAVLEAHRTAA